MNRKEIIKMAMDIDGHMNDYPGGINPKWDTLVKVVQTAITSDRNAVIGLLKGIDKTTLESPDGWWETSKGAEFGASRIAAIRARGEK